MSEGFSLASAGRALDGALSRLVNDLVAVPPPAGQEWSAALSKYRGAREGTMALIRDLTQEQCDFTPAPGVWSIGQNVEHLLLTERLYRTQFRNLIALAGKGGESNIALTFEHIDTSIAFIPRDVMPLLTIPLNIFNVFVPGIVRETMFRIPLISAVNPTASNPAPYHSVTDLRARAIASLAETGELFRGDLPSNLRNMTLSHPLLGTNNIPEIFGIITAHEERHHGQMRRVLENPRFPR
ncbi:MAG TPA: DinB family protein [Bryobacteraceae bacterium]|nr:DinB family protein [Bryobacteraceae bacterium]